jgi:hypothetical protein
MPEFSDQCREFKIVVPDKGLWGPLPIHQAGLSAQG